MLNNQQNIEQQQNVHVNVNQQHLKQGEKQEGGGGQEQHKTLNHNSLYYSFMQRYFVIYQNDIQKLCVHSNGICVIALRTDTGNKAPKRILKMIEVEQVRGKKKKGGVKLGVNTWVACFQSINGETHDIKAMVEGTVIEKNDNPKFEANCDDYLFVVQPWKKVNPEKLGMERLYNPE